MFALIATAALVVAGDPPAASVTDETRQAYQAAQDHAGRTPDDQVKLAYWCEAHGLSAEWMRHLAQAVLADPNHAAARGLLGLVSRRDRWMRPAAVADQVEADTDLKAKLAEYDARRSATPYTADGQFGLAQWAEDRGLKDQAKAHYTAVVRLDPRRDQAWKRLGYTKHDGRWLTDADLATAKADAEAQEVADKKWKPLLERWKSQLKRPSRRADAEALLLTITDPRAVPSVGKVFGTSEADGPRAVQLLGQIDAPAASKALAYLAMFGRAPATRQRATETLRGRDAREFADLLIAQIRDPIKYEVKPVGGPGSPGVLFIEGKQSNLKRLYSPPPVLQPGDRVRWDQARGMPVIDRQFAGYSTGFPNVTGHSKYQRMGMFAMDADGNSFSDVPVPTIFPYAAFAVASAPARPLPNNPEMRQALSTLQAAGMTRAQATSVARNANKGMVFSSILQSNQAFQNRANGERYLDAVNNNYFDMERAAVLNARQVAQEVQKTAAAADAQLKSDVRSLENWNRIIHDQSDRATSILTQVTGENPGPNQLGWSKWWVDQIGYALVTPQTRTNPTLVEEVPLSYQPQITPITTVTEVTGYQRISCFGAGTPVQTQTGPQPIEQLQVGDMVLTQSTATGALGYHPVLITHHNPPSATFRIKLADDTIVASHFHRFWVARRGWVMARDLKAGDPVRTLGGVVPVDSVEAGKVELVYNLDIADDADFFAGTSATLVHDNTLPDPRLIPFDQAPEVVANR